jgi:hypothetical protein
MIELFQNTMQELNAMLEHVKLWNEIGHWGASSIHQTKPS